MELEYVSCGFPLTLVFTHMRELMTYTFVEGVDYNPDLLTRSLIKDNIITYSNMTHYMSL